MTNRLKMTGLLITASVWCILPLCVSAAAAGVHRAEFDRMPYQLFEPAVKEGQRYPLVICLHGALGRGTDNAARGIEAYAALREPSVQARHPAFLLVPQCDKGFQWVDVPFGQGSYDLDQVPESLYMKKVYALVLEVIRNFPVDPARVYVTGQSMGGYGAWNFALRYPELTAALIPICGGASPRHAAAVKNIPIRFFHGAKDSVVPPSASRDMAEVLAAAGSTEFQYTELPDGEHAIMKEVWAVPGLIDWIFEQKKGKR